MKIILVLVAMASCLAMSIDAAQFRFDNYQVYKIKVESEAQLLALQEIENSASFEGGFDFWKSPVLGDEAELMVPPFEVPRFSAMINSLGIKSQLKIKDVQKLVSINYLFENYYVHFLCVFEILLSVSVDSSITSNRSARNRLHLIRNRPHLILVLITN